MFNIGDRVVVTETYGSDDDENIIGCVGTVTYIDRTTWPYQVDLDITDRTVGTEYRTALFSEDELELA